LSDYHHISRYIQANDHYARLADIELLSATPGTARAKMVIQEKHLNSAGTVHGGALFTLADFVFAVASNVHGRLAMAISATIHFLQAATQGTLFAEARELSLSHKLGTYEIRITDEQNNLIATFQGVVYRKSEGLPEWEN
jgi:acyl-CoA thioesterase